MSKIEDDPQVFLSDHDAAFWNAWQRVFGDVKCNLLCSWHVSRSWNMNLSSKDPELRKEMKNKLTTLVSEIDEPTFERIYDDFVQNYTKNEESKNFVEYFVKNYGGRKEKWAYCHRIGCGISVNMNLERWHRLLKYEEGNGKTIKRLDKSLSMVLNAISKKLTMERGKLTYKILLRFRGFEMIEAEERDPKQFYSLPKQSSTNCRTVRESHVQSMKILITQM
ncbi:uncharacterized protein TNCV_4492801 [Trichonephila clavipes]|uniref:MULE transposase domain-containing protein n=1 Tax=Trichonephila clavipes TaxID=2585209 RepID=A0A8X6STI7_TRICX|nr:uncharacterized protein TNCV_4492801 [Trichonephila clavipes]